MKECDFYISTEKSKLDLKVIFEFLSKESYWAKGRSMNTIEKSIQNSLCFGVYMNTNTQVGFARVVTDFAVFAWILDVFILHDFRGKGLSILLMNEIMRHPDLQNLQRWGLGTDDAHGLYQKYGFASVAKPEMFLEKTNKPN